MATASHVMSHEKSQNKAFVEVRPSSDPSKLCAFCQELINIEWASASRASEEMVETVHYSHHPTDDELKTYQYPFPFQVTLALKAFSDLPVL
jgi:hypothetical protein